MKKILFIFGCCVLLSFSYAREISSNLLYTLAIEIIATGEGTKEEVIGIFQVCAENHKKYSKQCAEVLQKLGVKEEKSESTTKENVRTLKEVVDGDTIKVEENGTTYNVRMIGLDAPESSTTRYGYVEEFGQEAKEHLKSLVEGKEITLEFDETQGEEDKYGRKLAYVLVGNVNINKQMIEDGYGWEYTYNLPYKYQSEFKEAQKTAELKNNGLRGATDGERVKDGETAQTTTSSYTTYNTSSCAGHIRETGPRGGCYYQDGNSKVYDPSKVCCK